VRVGVVADPGLPAEVAAALAAHGLAEHLAAKIGPCPRWVVETVSAVLPVSEAGIVPLAELAAIRRHRQGWDVVVYLTDLPRRSGTQPVVADLSITHAVALISLPPVGSVRLRRCVRDVVVYLLRRLAEERREHCQADCGHPEEVGRRRLLVPHLASATAAAGAAAAVGIFYNSIWGHGRGAPSVAPDPHHGRVGHGHGRLAADLQPPVGAAGRSSLAG
jgi:hypothetical protein